MSGVSVKKCLETPIQIHYKEIFILHLDNEIKFRVTGVSIANYSLQMSNQEGVKLQKKYNNCQVQKMSHQTGVKSKNCPIKEE